MDAISFQRTGLVALLAFAVTLACLWWLLHGRHALVVLDSPNHRSLHHKPVPRTGGLAIMGGVIVAGGAFYPSLPIFAGLLALMAVSFWDDWRGVPVRWRLGVHLATAAGVTATLAPAGAYWWWLAMIPATVWMINLYNFMDGADGLAGGMALFGFASYGFAAGMAGASWQGLSFSVAAAAAAFLCFNFSPARIFMGDAGSIPLGFLAAVLGWMGWRENAWPLWFPLMVFSPFIVDASTTLVRRWLRGASVLQAHREHYYQRLVLMGWGHRRVALVWYGLMAGAGVSSLWGLTLGATGQLALLAAWAGWYGMLMIMVDRSWARFAANEGRC